MQETTGDERVDTALSRLHDLSERNLDDQVRTLDEVHRTLAAILDGDSEDEQFPCSQ